MACCLREASLIALSICLPTHGWPFYRRVAQCQNAYSSLHRVGLVYGWMTRLILLLKGILGHFMLKITKKHVFLDFLLENSFFEIETQS